MAALVRVHFEMGGRVKRLHWGSSFELQMQRWAHCVRQRDGCQVGDVCIFINQSYLVSLLLKLWLVSFFIFIFLKMPTSRTINV